MAKKGKITVDFGQRKIILENQLKSDRKDILLNYSHTKDFKIDKTYKKDPFYGSMLIWEYKRNTPLNIIYKDAQEIRNIANELKLSDLEIATQEGDNLDENSCPKIIISSYDFEFAKI